MVGGHPTDLRPDDEGLLAEKTLLRAAIDRIDGLL
jgi:hypothetical protein